MADRAAMAGDAGNDRAPGANGRTYDAFISYSQRGDKAIAQAIRTVIQTAGKPWWRVRSLNVFLDATSLSAAPGLWGSIVEKLDHSRYLILLASPEAAQSKWVDKEVAHFIEAVGAGEPGAQENGDGVGRVLIGLTGGELAWDAAAGDFVWSAETPLPPVLRRRFREEPLWVDFRPFRADPGRATKSDQGFLHAALGLAATIKGVDKAELYSDELRQQRRALRLAYGAAAVVALLGVGAGIAAWVAVEQEARANAEAERAIRNFDIAKSTVDQVTRDIAQGLRDVEGIRIESLRTVLSRVEGAITRLADAAPDDPAVQGSRLTMLVEFGDTYLAAGDGAAALAAYEESLGIARSLAGTDPANTQWQRDVSLSLDRLGGMKLSAGELAEALALYEESLAIARTLAGMDPDNAEWQRDVAIGLERLGNLKARADDSVGAIAAYEGGIAIFRRLLETDPGNLEWQRDSSVPLAKLGDLRSRAGDWSGALAAYEESLANARRLVETDPGNTALAA